ncbi:hypothetical protein HZF05_08520 [Sphingomonas sp. CGMCC 1.13654]|uniref:Uncharacterized protein n=1 Tax=Sphingomonas chungangi TaxID=2683589 RepID=A0A838L3S7_9SPHN|nr:hypothetical protein [Sphingomonas chungangi]MBA2934143.1 hypothetical protein [Sphingomonas chungangi]MVW57184.1 hypothetical protein [Sphingomonas chungangi]
MANDEIGLLLNEIGNGLAHDKEYPLDGTFVYAEAAPAMVSTSIFKDLGDHLLFRISTNMVDDLILDLWDAAPTDRRWAAMQYWIAGGKFTASFTYPEEFDPEESVRERRDRILQQRYGNKRVVYPPL